MLRLIKQWLKEPVETTGEDGKRRMGRWQSQKPGTPQAGVITRWWPIST
jgi:RNA-directed DNA polymerase